MAVRIRLQQGQVEDLATISALPTASLEEVRSALNSACDVIHSPDGLISLVESHTKLDRHQAGAVIRASVGACSVIKKTDLTVDGFLAELHAGLQTEKSWDDNRAEKWGIVEQWVRTLVGVPAVDLSAAALDLAYDHAQILRRTRILTDIRPIFDDSGENLIGSVVTNTLRITYDDVNGDHEISVALDLRDIETLRKQCERAQKKSESCHGTLGRIGIPTYREESDDDTRTSSAIKAE